MERFSYIRNHLVTCPETPDETVFTSARGAKLIAEDGTEYLCLNDISSILGFNHPRFTREVSELVKTQLLCHAGMFSEPKERLIRNFMEVTHGDFDSIMIAGSGGETVDWSVKIARRVTGRDGIISFRHALHGRSFAGAFLSDTPARKDGFGSGLMNTHFWDFPSDGRAFEPSADEYSDIAAIIIEPYQAIGGMDSPSPEYWKWLRAYTRERGILLILDEIQTGFGKTGTFFAYESAGIVPDILLAGKGMSNGFGLGALLMTKEVGAAVKPRELSGGSADNNLMCSIVNLVFDIIRDENILSNVNRVSDELIQEASRILSGKGIPFSFHGKGLFLSLELPDGMAETVYETARARHILLGRTRTRIVVRAPLVLTTEDVNELCAVLSTVIK